MNKHTPGPWKVVHGDRCFLVETSEPLIQMVAVGSNKEGDEANARLIAEAPELLELVQYALAVSDKRLPLGKQWRDRALTAIAKVGGM